MRLGRVPNPVPSGPSSSELSAPKMEEWASSPSRPSLPCPWPDQIRTANGSEHPIINSAAAMPGKRAQLWRRAQTSQTSLPSQPATRVPFFDTSMLGVLKDFCPSYANPLLRTFLACCTADSDTDDNLFLSESYKQFFCPNTQYR